jgi:hypothetical protein
MFHQDGDVAFAFAKRGQLNLENVQAVVEVRAETPFFDKLFKVFVGRGDCSENRRGSDECCRHE